MNENCLFCRIIQKQIPGKFALETEDVVALYDVNPQAPVHLLVMPRKHIASIDDASDADALLIGELIIIGKRLASEHKLTQGYRLVFNNGRGAGQSVFHIHLHVLGGRTMNWPPG